jgi:zinc protease
MPSLNLDFRRHRLDNGLTILLLEDRSLPIVSYQVHFGVGSRNERPGITGISHLFEHMMFRGSKELGPKEFARIIQANGGSLNAFTTHDHTSYYENLPADRLELAVRLEAERMQHLQLTEETLETERQVVRSERKMRTVNSPYGLLLEQLFAIAFNHHPYQWPIIGWDHDLQVLTLRDCIEYHRKGYAPNNAVVAVVGDVDADQALRLVKRHYGAIPAQAPMESITAVEPMQRGERRSVYKKVSQLEAFFAGFHTPGIDHQDIPALLAVSHLLSSGRSSRFYRRFVKPGRAVDAKVDLDPPPFSMRDPGLLYVYAIAAPGTDIDTLEKDLWQEVGTIQRGEIDPEELRKAKKGLEANFLMGLQSIFMKGLTLGIYEIKTGDASRVNDLLPGIRDISLEAVRRVARQYLTEDNRTVVTLRPISPEENERFDPLE